jgi:hypothetical protein
MAKRTINSLIGPSFDQEQTNEEGRVENYISELRYRRPRGFAKLAKEGASILRQYGNDEQTFAFEWMQECDELLSAWAQRVTGSCYIAFGPFEHTGDVGFYALVESAQEDADLTVDDTSEVPKGFSGLVAQVSDHGNVSIYLYSRGRSRELFSVV